MTKYAKLNKEGKLSLAPRNKNGVINYNLNEKLLKLDGYKKFIEVEKTQNDRKFEIIYQENPENIIEIINYLETEEEYQTRKENESLQLEIDSLTSAIQEIDFKRIRALCEPSVKDEESGETWLEYYNAQILDLRTQLQDLKERITQNDIAE